MRVENPYLPSPLSKGPRFISEYLPKRTNGLNQEEALRVEKTVALTDFANNNGAEHTVFQANSNPKQAEPAFVESLPIHPIPQH